MESVTDEILLQRIVSRDEEAFALFYDRYGTLAYSLSYRILGDGTDAEDAVQEVFLNVWRKVWSFDIKRGSVRTWLLSMVHHRSIDIVRRRRGQPLLAEPSNFNNLATEAEDVWHTVASSLDSQVIQRALAQIPEGQRKVIELAYFGGYTHREIADLINLKLGTVKGRLRMGIEKLRGLLKDEGLAKSDAESQ